MGWGGVETRRSTHRFDPGMAMRRSDGPEEMAMTQEERTRKRWRGCKDEVDVAGANRNERDGKRSQEGPDGKDEPSRKRNKVLRTAIPPPMPTQKEAYPELQDKQSSSERPPGKVRKNGRVEREDASETAGRRKLTRTTPPNPWMLQDGHYDYELGENITPRFKIVAKIGEGTFGRVFECWDRLEHKYVALKVIKSIEKYRQAALHEIHVLAMLKANEAKNVVELLGWFDYKGYICIVFEKLGPTLYDLLRKNGYLPFRLEIVKELGKQLLQAVSCMHELEMIHTDLKPENILFEKAWKKVKYGTRTLREPQSNGIKLIDFGSTAFKNGHHPKVVSTRHYRAPEIILGLGWSFPCDMWSIGCVLFELIAGEALFQTHEDSEHLAMMKAALGPCPQDIVDRAKENGYNCSGEGKHACPDNSPRAERCRKALAKMLPLKEMIATVVNDPNMVITVSDCLAKLLQYDPKDRPSARNLLEHEFFNPTTIVG